MDNLSACSPVAQIQHVTETVVDVNKVAGKGETSLQNKSYASIQVGSIVKHKTFKEGTNVKLSSKHITVKFKQGTKKFIFPDAFQDGFLEL